MCELNRDKIFDGWPSQILDIFLHQQQCTTQHLEKVISWAILLYLHPNAHNID